MAFDLTGIQNHNEFYTHHYLTTLLANDVKGVLSAWEAQEKEQNIPAPHREIRALGRRFFNILDESKKEKGLVAKLELQNDLLADFFSALGYEIAPSAVAIDEDLSIPVLTQLVKANGVPQLWIISVVDRGQERTNPLDCELQTEVCTPGVQASACSMTEVCTPGVQASACSMTEVCTPGVQASACSVEDFITKRIFTL
ncbi:MAG: hypothetical protein GY927_00015, partial [bacterium]|nr:hypothetical protein [bacterium]